MSYQRYHQNWNVFSTIFVSTLLLCSCTVENSSTAIKPTPSVTNKLPLASTGSSGIPSALSSSIPSALSSALSSLLPHSGSDKTTQSRDCPANKPIKGKLGWTGKTYYGPDSKKYSKVKPHECFTTVKEALSAGYNAPKTKKQVESPAPNASNATSL